jgi:hypothetical protein
MGVEINEPWTHNQTMCVQRFLSVARLSLPLRAIFATLPSLYRHPRRTVGAGAIDDCASLDKHIKVSHIALLWWLVVE